MINFDKCVLNDIKFIHCKLLGPKFDKCNKFGFSVSFVDRNLFNSTFYAREMKLTSIFDQTILTQVDFITSYNYSFNPNTNKISGAKFGVDGLPRLLNQYGFQVKF